jgi:hypothetical protein
MKKTFLRTRFYNRRERTVASTAGETRHPARSSAVSELEAGARSRSTVPYTRLAAGQLGRNLYTHMGR